MRVLVIDVGGSHVKLLATGRKTPIKIPSGPDLTAKQLVRAVRTAAADWAYDAVSIGYPGPVVNGRIVSEPRHLGGGWIGFNFRRAFGRPVKVINDAAMQALGSYRGGRMLFLGLGTGMGSAVIVDGVLQPMELGHLPYRKGRTYEDYVGESGLKRSGKKKWRRRVADVVKRLRAALQVTDVVLGGGNAKLLDRAPRGVRLGSNAYAFTGGFLLWSSTRRHRPAGRVGLGRRVGARIGDPGADDPATARSTARTSASGRRAGRTRDIRRSSSRR